MVYIKDGYASYDDYGVMEIPIKKLFNHNAGELSKLTEDNITSILGYLMEEPSPFNSILPDLRRNAHRLRCNLIFVVDLEHPSIQTPIYGDDPCFLDCYRYCDKTLDLILELGIPAKNGYSLWDLNNGGIDRNKKQISELPLRWAAARGPWPEQNETNMCEARLKICLECVWNSLIDLMSLTIRHSNLSRKHKTFVDMKSYARFIQYAWDGVGGWRC